MLSTCWLLLLHSAVQLIPTISIGLRSCDCGGQGHLMQHLITILLGQIVLTQPGCVLGHCPVEKQLIVPLSANQMG
jgi:hypothetical protein